MDKKTPLYERHMEYGGKIVSFAGHLLPIQYKSGLVSEHMAVRNAAGLFDVSHMGEVMISGPDALCNIQNLLSNDFSDMADGRVRYSPMLNHEGGTVDDLIVYRFSQNEYFLVINAANREKDVLWMKKHLQGDVDFEDISDSTAQLALQGPASYEILKKLVDEDRIPKKYYSFVHNIDIKGMPCIVSKTGYTGEDGFEIYCENDAAPLIWDELMKAGGDLGLLPCGLGARDTLRLEAGMPLYGHELSEEISPLEAGLSFFVKMDKEGFIGKQGLINRGEPKIKRVGLRVLDRGIAREGFEVYAGDRKAGHVTSGTHCPYLGYPAAMAFVDREFSELGTKLDVIIRGKRVLAEVCALPFYKLKK